MSWTVLYQGELVGWPQTLYLGLAATGNNSWDMGTFSFEALRAGVASLKLSPLSSFLRGDSNEDGAVDPAWDPDAGGWVLVPAVSEDGSTVYAGGDLDNIGQQKHPHFAQFDSLTSGGVPFRRGDANNDGETKLEGIPLIVCR